MDQTTLVSPDVEAGSEAVAALDQAKIRPLVAMLMVLPDYGDWRLVLSSSALDQNHQLKAHEQVASILKGRFVYTLPPILILPVKDPLIKELRRLFAKAKSVAGMRLGGQMLANRFILDAYVYRIE